jgi:hypothetical protein
MYMSPSEQIAVIALINADDGHPYPGRPDSVVDRAFKWVAPAITKAVAPQDKKEKVRPQWQKYVGKYRDPWGDSQVILMNGKLLLIDPTSPDPAEFAATLVPVEEHVFRMVGGSTYGPHGELVVFELDDAGKVARVKIGENYTFPRQ